MHQLHICIGLISDTHMPDRLAALPPAIFTALQGVDLLLHAGDVGELWVLDKLAAIAPVVAVHGNDDTAEAQRELPYQQLLSVAGQRIVLTHAHYPDRHQELASRRDDSWAPMLERRLQFARSAGASIVVFGHSHIPLAVQREGVLLVNPGAIAPPNEIMRQDVQSVARLYIGHDGAVAVVHINLQTPDQPYTPPIDLEGGFRAAFNNFASSILQPKLADDYSRLRVALNALQPAVSLSPHGTSYAIFRRAAHRVWAGELAALGHADLLAALGDEPGLSVELRAEAERIITQSIKV